MSKAVSQHGDRLRPGCRRGARPQVLVRAAFLLLVSCCILLAETRKPTDYEVKAAYLFQFGKFVKWPSSASTPNNTFPICVMGNENLSNLVQSIVAGESMEGKRLSVQRVNSTPEASQCRILYVGNIDAFRWGVLKASIERAPILTVSDVPGFVEHGGMIQFVNDGDRVRFLVNLSAAEHSGLTLSSELLKVAVSVKRDGQAGQ